MFIEEEASIEYLMPCTVLQIKIEKLRVEKLKDWQRMLKISWTEQMTNDEVLVCANEARSVLKMIWCRKHRWLGHVLRHDNLLHDMEIDGQGYW